METGAVSPWHVFKNLYTYAIRNGTFECGLKKINNISVPASVWRRLTVWHPRWCKRSLDDSKMLTIAGSSKAGHRFTSWAAPEMSRYPEKCTSWHLRSSKTQISLRIRAVWSESSIGALWVAKGPMLLHADFYQTVWMRRLVWIFAVRTCQVIPYDGYRLSGS